MISGIGIDIIELDRIKELVEKKQGFAKRILTEKELINYKKLKGNRKIEYLAGRFAAKEAFSKAVGTGIGKNLSFQDIEVDKDGQGKPYIVKPISSGVHISITHSREYACAQVVIEKE
ncbi:holo-ACP synthase [Niallia sp. NCCP-28]|uniref:holo-ACP synthase n=1 Tax=Niallia sp. NCCP-28 TaxID=2934712 RepID=UPI002086C1AC|nr:holo-ACP synthase [Niallia sp. NCCP-28]GKU84646.1 holo-[acyl-carrier-protein] synthase [Niallia sp. NCCP-28]